MSTPYSNVYQDSISGTVDSDFTVPAGNWVFQNWSAGAQLVNGSSTKIELFWDADGSGSSLQLVDAIYTASETYNHELDQTVLWVSSGSSRIIVRRTVLSGTTAREIYSQYQGFVA